jgi:hypothetical protein
VCDKEVDLHGLETGKRCGGEVDDRPRKGCIGMYVARGGGPWLPWGWWGYKLVGSTFF